MRLPTQLLALPVSLLAVIVQSSSVEAEPLSLDSAPQERYYPEHDAVFQRNLQIQRRVRTTSPLGVRKMGRDEGEKFFLDYWDLGETVTTQSAMSNTSSADIDNASTARKLLPPVLLHSRGESHRSIVHIFGRSIFQRDFQCPTGTTSCASIGQSDACCALSETCITVQDTGNGPVGCCPSGETCGGQVVGCDIAAGYTSCPDSSNGGCCIPGYTCQGVGCVYTGSTTTTTTLPIATVTTGVTSTQASSKPSTTTSTTESTVQTRTTTILSTLAASTGIVTVTETIVTSPSSTITTETSTSASAVAPMRPTSGSSDSSSSDTTSTATYSACPTGFYMCSAYYLGGCCRVGRNCDTTSCPASESTSVVVTSGLTIVAGGSGASLVIGTATTTTTSISGAATGCASGWFGCANSVGGGCCPSGFICGAVSCTATASGQSNIGKESSGATRSGYVAAWGLGVLALVAGLGMVVL